MLLNETQRQALSSVALKSPFHRGTLPLVKETLVSVRRIIVAGGGAAGLMAAGQAALAGQRARLALAARGLRCGTITAPEDVVPAYLRQKVAQKPGRSHP